MSTKKERDITSSIVTRNPKNKKEDYKVLQLHAKAIDICRISKLLVRYNIEASITDSVITLDGDISDELLTQLCGNMDINAVQNFSSSQEPSYVSSEYDLIYSEVKRGEVYLCDFGEPYGSEQGFKRYAIVIQNDAGNLHSPTTIVIPCTTEHKKKLPVHLYCTFSSRNMLDYDLERVGTAENVIMAEQIQTVDKTRLRKYLGTLTPEFMKIIDGKINISLHLGREVKNIVKQEEMYGDKSKILFETEEPQERKDVNIIQVQLLSFVNINELLKISQSNSTDEVKVQRILDLFGFDCKKNGVQYLLKAIIASPKNDYFNLETLCESVSRKENIDKEEIKRLIVARVKETFGFRKAPTIDFIRLVNIFLLKQEVSYEESNI